MIEVPTAQPRKIPSTTLTNKYAEAINTLGQLFRSGSGQVQDMAILPVRVRISSAASGGGKYIGRVLNPPASSVAATGTLSAADLGDDPGADNALILNAEEVGQATHDLTGGTPKVANFIGILFGFATDGKYLVMINGIDWEACT